MPHITMGTVESLREQIVHGARLERQFWKNDDAPHVYVGSFHTAQRVTWHADGGVTVQTYYYVESSRNPRTLDLHWASDDVVAIVAMKPLGTSAETYAHRDDRVILAGGYADAQGGTMRCVWDAHRVDGTPSLRDVTFAEAREFIAA